MSQSLLEKQKQSLAKWPSISLRYAADIRNSNVDKKSYENGAPVKLCNYTDVYYNEKITSALSFMRATATQNELERFQLREGDVIITKDSESWDDIGVPACVDEPLPNVVCGYHLCLLRPKSEVLNGRYLLRALQSGGIREKLWLASRGVTRFGLGLDGIRDLQLPLPPLPTQKAIANFLDRKTAAIDALIEKKEKLLELLAEKRSALINQAVTKGLDPNMPMKDSGIPWIGEIPEHWEFLPVKRVARVFVPGRDKPDLNDVDGLPWVTLDQLGKIYHQAESAQYRVSDDAAKNVGARAVPSNSVMTGCVGSFGSAAINREPVFCNQQIQAYTALVRLESEYLAYIISISSPYSESIGTATTIKYLNAERFGMLPIPLPPVSEQKRIIAWLSSELPRIDRVKAIVSEQKTKLHEYRQSLITAAVTGQVEIPTEDYA